MKVLCWTQPMDPHSMAVERVLEARGHHVDRLFPGDLPDRATLSLSYDNGLSARYREIDGRSLILDHDVVWLRRPVPPIVRDLAAHPSDLPLIELENEAFAEALWYAVLPRAAWVNPPLGRLRADAKALQLRLARAAQLKIPRTLISNDPQRIREFLRSTPDGAIYKAFRQDRWGADGRVVARIMTVPISADSLPDDRILRLTPGIFQERVPKHYEVRATFFDDFDVSVEIDSQAHPLGREDWREIPKSSLRLSRIEIPSEVRSGCIKLMHELGIRFGCFDFIVNDDGWTFLEVNQMGQFLWVETIDPGIRMLSTFCQFLVRSPSEGAFEPKDDDVTFRGVLPPREFRAIAADEGERHRSPYLPPLVA